MENRIIHEAVSVKNATLMYIYETKTYSLIHYETEILRIVNGEITVIKPVSNTSSRAINQVLQFLNIPQPITKLTKDINGKSVKVLKNEFNNKHKELNYNNKEELV